MRWSILLLFLLVGCGKIHNTIDAPFQSLYYEFLQDAQNHGIVFDARTSDDTGMIIHMVDDIPGEDRSVVGDCLSFDGKAGMIYIQAEFWNESSDLVHKALIYHELGHCMLNRQHTSDPTSIMQPLAGDSANALLTNPVAALNELFRANL